jgi:hypothetical protein
MRCSWVFVSPLKFSLLVGWFNNVSIKGSAGKEKSWKTNKEMVGPDLRTGTHQQDPCSEVDDDDDDDILLLRN